MQYLVAQSLTPLPPALRTPVASSGRGRPAKEGSKPRRNSIWRPFACAFPGCQARIRCRSEMIRHLSSHTGQRSFFCTHEDCGKTFVQHNALQAHLRRHTGEKTFACSFTGCRKTFLHRAELKKHRHAHSGEKPFVCGCGKTFGYSWNLQAHQRFYAQNPACRAPSFWHYEGDSGTFAPEAAPARHRPSSDQTEPRELAHKDNRAWADSDPASCHSSRDPRCERVPGVCQPDGQSPWAAPAPAPFLAPFPTPVPCPTAVPVPCPAPFPVPCPVPYPVPVYNSAMAVPPESAPAPEYDRLPGAVTDHRLYSTGSGPVPPPMPAMTGPHPMRDERLPWQAPDPLYGLQEPCWNAPGPCYGDGDLSRWRMTPQDSEQLTGWPPVYCP